MAKNERILGPESQVEVVSLEKLEDRITPSAHSLLTPEFIQSLVDGGDLAGTIAQYDSFTPGGGDNK